MILQVCETYFAFTYNKQALEERVFIRIVLGISLTKYSQAGEYVGEVGARQLRQL